MAEKFKNEEIDHEISDLLLKYAVDDCVNDECEEIAEKYKDTRPEYSKAHEHRMKQILSESGKNGISQHSWARGLKRAAIIVLALIVCGTAAMNVEAVRIEVLNFLYSFSDESTDIYISKTEGISEEVPDGWDYAYFLGYVPQGYVLCKTELLDDTFYRLEYTNSQGQSIIFKQYRNDEGNWSIDSEGAKISTCYINKLEATVYEKKERTVLWWDNQDYYLYLLSSLSKDESIKIAENLVKKEQ